jgi:hypothetical protein
MSEAGIVVPELKWPMTNFTPWPANLLAIETASRGSETSSPIETVIFSPKKAACCVDVGDRLARAILELHAEGRVGSGERPGHAHLDLGLRRAGRCKHKSDKPAPKGEAGLLC